MQKHEFKMFINDDTFTLILGSFPSVKSRKDKFYYMHSSNRFYKVLSAVYKEKELINRDIEIKKNILKKHNIGLYDVIKECEISLSDDNTIKKEKPINLKKILKTYPIKKILINGNKAKELYLKYFKDIQIEAIFLPSTSARNVKYSLEDLILLWEKALL